MAQESHLHDALKTIVATFGDQLYNDPKLINYISDYYHFDPMALYHVMKTLVHDGYPGRMLHEGKHGDWKLFVQQSMAKVQKQYGFAPSYVNYCFQSLAYGIGLYPQVKQRLLDEIEGRVAPIPIPIPSAPSGGNSSAAPSSSSKKNTTSQKPATKRKPQTQTQPKPQWQPKPWQNPQNTANPSQQGTPSSNLNGCSGCFDSMTNIYTVVILIIWLLMQCSDF